jgi:hypothetical protein
MWTSRNLVALGLFLFGTAFLWLAAAVVFGIAGLVAVVSFAAGQSQLDAGFADFGVQINLWMHIVGSAAVVAIVLVPVAHDWVTRRL